MSLLDVVTARLLVWDLENANYDVYRYFPLLKSDEWAKLNWELSEHSFDDLFFLKASRHAPLET